MTTTTSVSMANLNRRRNIRCLCNHFFFEHIWCVYKTLFSLTFTQALNENRIRVFFEQLISITRSSHILERYFTEKKRYVLKLFIQCCSELERCTFVTIELWDEPSVLDVYACERALCSGITSCKIRTKSTHRDIQLKPYILLSS